MTIQGNIIKQGQLRVKKKNSNTWKSRWVVLRQGKEASSQMLELYTSKDTAQFGKSEKIYELTSGMETKLTKADGQSWIISITYKSAHRQFMANNEIEANEWINALSLRNANYYYLNQSGVQPGNQTRQRQSQNVDANRRISLNGSISSKSSSSSCDPYVVMNCFQVRMLSNSKLMYSEFVLLHIVNKQIKVTETIPPFKEYASWPFSYIRNYNHSNDIFNFECGRSSETGEGTFYFGSPQAKAIFNLVHSTSQAISKSLKQQDSRLSINGSMSSGSWETNSIASNQSTSKLISQIEPPEYIAPTPPNLMQCRSISAISSTSSSCSSRQLTSRPSNQSLQSLQSIHSPQTENYYNAVRMPQQPLPQQRASNRRTSAETPPRQPQTAPHHTSPQVPPRPDNCNVKSSRVSEGFPADFNLRRDELAKSQNSRSNHFTLPAGSTPMPMDSGTPGSRSTPERPLPSIPLKEGYLKNNYPTRVI